MGRVRWATALFAVLVAVQATAVVGATSEEPGPVGVLISQAGATPGVVETRDFFSDAAASGDFNGDNRLDLAVAASHENIGALTSAGAVNVFYAPGALGEDATAPQLISQLGPVPGSPEHGDVFGHVLTAGDFNGDGFDDLAVAAPGESLGSVTDVGMVTVFYGSGNGLDMTSAMGFHAHTGTGEAPGDDNGFGASLAAADFDADGFDDLVVGSRRPSTSGAVRVYSGSATGISPAQGQLIVSANVGGTDETMMFGDAITTGDFNGDAIADLVVRDAAPFPDGFALAIVPGSETGLRLDWTVRLDKDSDPSGLATEINFGQALAAGDLDADGYDELIAGTDQARTDGHTDAGAVGVYSNVMFDSRTATVLSQSGSAPGIPEPNDEFGRAVHVADFDGDLIDDLAIGVPGEEAGNRPADHGVVHVILGSPSGIDPDNQTLLWQGKGALPGRAETDDGFGLTLSAADLNGDFVNELFVGAPREGWGSRNNAGAGMLIALPAAPDPVQLTETSCQNGSFRVTFPETAITQIGWSGESFFACQVFAVDTDAIAPRNIRIIDGVRTFRIFHEIYNELPWSLTVHELNESEGLAPSIQNSIRYLDGLSDFVYDPTVPLAQQVPPEITATDTTDPVTGRRTVRLEAVATRQLGGEVVNTVIWLVEDQGRLFQVGAYDDRPGFWTQHLAIGEQLAASIAPAAQH